jgi:putative component of toxin-antitoxin plasmid stabilization module
MTASGAAAEHGTEPGSGRRLAELGYGALDRLYAFRVTYVAIFVFLLLYVFTVKGTEQALQSHFEGIVAESVRITDLSLPVTMQIQSRIDRRVMQSRWVLWGGIHANIIVLAADGQTWIYVGGRTVQPPASLDSGEIAREAARLLPATDQVGISVPHNALVANAILVTYAALLLSVLYVYNRAVGRREARRLETAVLSRDETLARAGAIEHELEQVRRRLTEVVPAEREQADEIRALQSERGALHAKLAELADREEELRQKAARTVELDQEPQALEELLEEAGGELAAKDDEIRQLGKSLKRAAVNPSARGRETEQLKRRLDTLYKTLEIDPRAISDLVALRDETMKLKAEEGLKRLGDDAGNVGVRRKVGGLPPSLSVFELGFAGKGRIYYCRGKQRRFRVLCVGAKNTQKTDLDYLRKLSL